MEQLEIWQTISETTHNAIQDGLHRLSEHELLRRADEILRRMPVVGGAQPTAALLLRRYQFALRKELCEGPRPRSLPEDVEEQVRELTRAVMVTVDLNEGFSIEAAVLLARAGWRTSARGRRGRASNATGIRGNVSRKGGCPLGQGATRSYGGGGAPPPPVAPS